LHFCGTIGSGRNLHIVSANRGLGASVGIAVSAVTLNLWKRLVTGSFIHVIVVGATIFKNE
jgi:hypothetical protein